ncbi:hypothetical protein [Neobacillus drentensis]|uniref:hypothetical protein n=1 Tax=Neobacillus drentensis TaxID=220684 RepID=UPI002864BF8B|nr:hypothetical protein [Neobacillus drentensis]MDR7238215.1 hypothetical protein [Neobacillus drentensis]
MFFLPTKVNIGAFKLNNIDHSSSISFSSTIKKNRNVSAKKNQGFGQQMADNTLRVYSKSSVVDNDIEDSCTERSNI